MFGPSRGVFSFGGAPFSVGSTYGYSRRRPSGKGLGGRTSPFMSSQAWLLSSGRLQFPWTALGPLVYCRANNRRDILLREMFHALTPSGLSHPRIPDRPAG